MSQLKPVEYDKQSTENKCTSYSLCQLVFNRIYLKFASFAGTA